MLSYYCFIPVGGGGTVNIYWWGCAAAYKKPPRHNPQKCQLGTGMSRKRGSQARARAEKGGRRNGFCKKEDISN